MLHVWELIYSSRQVSDGDTFTPLLLLEKPRHKEVKDFAPCYSVTKWQSWYHNVFAELLPDFIYFFFYFLSSSGDIFSLLSEREKGRERNIEGRETH